jgi:hypothetical protein
MADGFGGYEGQLGKETHSNVAIYRLAELLR